MNIDNIYSDKTLRQAILDLEARQDQQREEIHQHFKDTYESVKPINLIKSTLKDAFESLEVKGNLVNTGIGLVAGFLGKRVYEASTSTESLFKKLVGTGIMFVITNLVTRNPEVVKSIEDQVVGFVKNKFNMKSNEEEEE